MSYSNELDSNNKDLQSILETINNLPEAGGSSGPCSWNDITDKPFYEETPEPFTFDGNPEGKDIVSIQGGVLVRVSDKYFSIDELAGITLHAGCIEQYVGDTVPLGEVRPLTDFNATDPESFVITFEGQIPLIVSVHSTESFRFLGANLTFNEGLYIIGGYFEDYPENSIYGVSTLNFPPQIKKIEQKYLPEPLAYDDTIPPIFFDGNIEGKELIIFLPFERGQPYVKLSDDYYPPERMIGTTAYGGNSKNLKIFSGTIATKDDIVYFDEELGIDKDTYSCCINVGGSNPQYRHVGIMVAKAQNLYMTDELLIKYLGVTQEEIDEAGEELEPYRNIRLTPGMYFMINLSKWTTGDPVQWVTSVTFPECIKTVDEKFLPEPLAYDRTPNSLTWDGNAEGLDTIMGMAYKFSDEVFTIDQLVGATVQRMYNGVIVETVLSESTLVQVAEGCVIGTDDNEMLFVSSSVTGDIGGTIIPSTGTYGVLDQSTSNWHVYLSSIEFPSQIKKIDEKFLPEPLAYDKTPEPIVWDGNTEGLVYFPLNASTIGYRISDEFLPNEGIVGGIGYLSNRSDGSLVNSLEVTEDLIVPLTAVGVGFTDAESWGVMYMDTPCVISVHSDETISGYGVVPAGLYLLQTTSFYVSRFEFAESIKAIDEKFIPEISWNKITDKPFGEEEARAPITWDGNTEGREVIDLVSIMGAQFVKVSDVPATIGQLVGGNFSMYEPADDAGGTMTITPEGSGGWFDIMTMDGLIIVGNGEIVSAENDDTESMGVIFNKGIYFMLSTGGVSYDEGVYVSSLEFSNTSVKTLDEKYLPASVSKIHRVIINLDYLTMSAYGMILHVSTQYMNELVRAFRLGDVIVFDASLAYGTPHCTRPLSMGKETSGKEPVRGLYKFTGINPQTLEIEVLYLTDQAKED